MAYQDPSAVQEPCALTHYTRNSVPGETATGQSKMMTQDHRLVNYLPRLAAATAGGGHVDWSSWLSSGRF